MFIDIVDTHVLAVEVYLRKRRYLLVLQALKRVLSFTNPTMSPDVHVALLTFLHEFEQQQHQLPTIVKQVIQQQLQSAQFGAGKSVQQLNQEYLKANQSNFACRLAGKQNYTII